MASSAIPEDHAVPTVGSVTSFEDSLEVLGISAGYREARPASSLGLKAANASKSGACFLWLENCPSVILK